MGQKFSSSAMHINTLVTTHWKIYRFAKQKGGYALIYMLHYLAAGSSSQYRLHKATGLQRAHVIRLVTRGVKMGYISVRPLQITSKGKLVLDQYYLLLSGEY